MAGDGPVLGTRGTVGHGRATGKPDETHRAAATETAAEGRSRASIIAALKADTVSIVTFEIGLFGWMALDAFVLFPGESIATWNHWFQMQIGMIIGFFTSYPANWFLLKKGRNPCDPTPGTLGGRCRRDSFTRVWCIRVHSGSQRGISRTLGAAAPARPSRCLFMTWGPCCATGRRTRSVAKQCNTAYPDATMLAGVAGTSMGHSL